MNNYNFVSKSTIYTVEETYLYPSPLKNIEKLYDLREEKGDYLYEVCYPQHNFSHKEGSITIKKFNERICKNPKEPYCTIGELYTEDFSVYKNFYENSFLLERDEDYNWCKFISPLIERVVKKTSKGNFVAYNIYYEECSKPEFHYNEEKGNKEQLYEFATEMIKYFSDFEGDKQTYYKVHINILTQEIKWYKFISKDSPEESLCIQDWDFV